ncbi:adenylate/guanylate cyclase domain-containing protein [Thermodesulfobacteriota bacterium]
MDNPIAGTKIDDPLYNSRIINNYAVYVKQFYPHLDLNSLLEYAWIKPYELEDQGHWFSQWQVDRFHELLYKETKLSEISREVGRYAASAEASGALKHYVMGFMSPSAAYWVLEKFTPHLTRASTYKTKKLGTNKVEVIVTPNPGVAEKRYQCENRAGLFEAIPKLFTNSFAEVEHTTCIHRGGDVCRYIITWDSSAIMVWKRIRYYLIALSLVSCAALYFFVPPSYFAAIVFLLASIIVMIAFHSEGAEKKELVKNIREQSDAARNLLNEINLRYNDATLIKEIGQTTSKLMDVDEMFSSVILSIEKHLDYDRGGIWLANDKRTELSYKIGYGYDSEIETLLRNSSFHIRVESKGVAVQAFLKQRPFLVNNIRDLEGSLSKRSFEFMKKTRAQSFICVPLVYENDSFGVLFVDNLKSKRPLGQSDISLLSGVSRQLAISIHNSISYHKLSESRQREHSLRKLFERYVPASIIKRYVDSGDIDLFQGEELNITTMFLDIRDFTLHSEDMEPSDVVSFLNGFFQGCSQIISEMHGHINKYTGDGFLAIFGAPEPLEDHVNRAFEAMYRILKLTEKHLLGGRPMGVGVGIHTGQAILGNIGSQTEMEYTAVGDIVNTAARLEELCKVFPEFPVIISSNVWEKIDNEHRLKKLFSNLGPQEIRGKKDRIDVYGFNPSKDDLSHS